MTPEQVKYLRDALESIEDRQINALLPAFDADMEREKARAEVPALPDGHRIRRTQNNTLYLDPPGGWEIGLRIGKDDERCQALEALCYRYRHLEQAE